MTAMLLTETNLIHIKRTLRNVHPAVKSSHISEALAYSFGRNTHAALLVDKHNANARPRLVNFDRKRFAERITQLDSSIGASMPAFKILDSSEFPDPIWKIFKDRNDLNGINRWFYESQRREIPYVYILVRRRYARVDWDCITLDSRHDKAINGSAALVDTMLKRFQFLAEPRKAFFEGSAFVGHIDTLLPESAYKIADEIFGLLYQAIGLTENHADIQAVIRHTDRNRLATETSSSISGQ